MCAIVFCNMQSISAMALRVDFSGDIVKYVGVTYTNNYTN